MYFNTSIIKKDLLNLKGKELKHSAKHNFATKVYP